MSQAPESYDLQEEPTPPPATAHTATVLDDAPAHVDPPRRGFLRQALAVAVGALAGIIPGAAGLLVFTDPLRRTRAAASFLPVAPLDAVPPDGTPRKFQLTVEKVDAWNRSKDVASVYLVREPGSQTVSCYHTACPHAGCAVEWTPGAGGSASGSADGAFKCPCHNSSFKKDGSLIDGSVSPRGLDPLEVDPDALQQGQVKVKYQEFLAGKHDRVPKA